MDTAAEAEVLQVLAIGVEPIGVRYVLRVAAAGGEDKDDRCAVGEGGAGDLDVVKGAAAGQAGDRRFGGQKFLYPPDRQVRPAARGVADIGGADERGPGRGGAGGGPFV